MSASSSMELPSSTAPVSRRDCDAGMLQRVPAVVSAPKAAQAIQRIERPQPESRLAARKMIFGKVGLTLLILLELARSSELTILDNG